MTHIREAYLIRIERETKRGRNDARRVNGYQTGAVLRGFRLGRRRRYLREGRGLRGEQSRRGERRRPNDNRDVEHRAILPCEPPACDGERARGKFATDRGCAAKPGRAKGVTRWQRSSRRRGADLSISAAT